MKIIEYMILWAVTIQEIDAIVDEYIHKGWQPFGACFMAPSIAVGAYDLMQIPDGDVCVCQPMVRYEI